MKNNMNFNGKKKGFTLIEIIIVIAIIGILSAVLVPAIFGYVEKARNKADLSNARNICNALQLAVIESPDNVINYETPWKGDKNNENHGYVYVDDNEIRVSNIEIAYILAEAGIIKQSSVAKYRLREGVEPQYSIDKINVTCQSRKKWDRYQINFVYVDGELEFSYSASKDGLSKDPETTEVFAKALNGQEGGSEIQLGGKN